MKGMLKDLGVLFVKKTIGKTKFFKTTKGVFIKIGVIGILLYLSVMLIFLAGIIALVWVMTQNV